MNDSEEEDTNKERHFLPILPQVFPLSHVTSGDVVSSRVSQIANRRDHPREELGNPDMMPRSFDSGDD
jgi:hypothetical protein